jgi:hypothetical protein
MEVRIMRRSLVLLIGLPGLVAVGLVAGCGGGSAGSTAKGAKAARVVITHVSRGCHDWSVNGGAASANQTVRLARGGSVTITDNDVMPHTLLQTKGPAAAVAVTPKMAHMGAQANVSFPSSGVYHFVTKAGEDYPSASGVKTVGADHTLRLTVVVAS